MLQTVQARRRHRRGIRRQHVLATASVDKERNGAVHQEPTAGNGNPDVPIDRQGLGDVFGQRFQNAEILCGEVPVSQGSDERQGLVEGLVEGDVGQED